MKRNRSAHRNTRGFSLVEVLAATVLMAIILSAIGTITAQWLPNWGRGFLRVQHSELMALGVERIVADLAAAEMVPAGRVLPPFIFDGNEASVTFVRTAIGPNAGGGLELVRIGAVEDDRGPALVRARARFHSGERGDTAEVLRSGRPHARAIPRIVLLRGGGSHLA